MKPLLVIAFAIGAAAALVVMPTWLPALTASLTGSEPHAYWYLSRTSGVIAFVLLWVSTLAGLGLSTKLAKRWPGAASALALHRELAWSGLVVTLFHALVLLGDRHVGFSLAGVLVPFASDHARAAVALGQLAAWASVLLAASFRLRKQLGPGSWRIVHYASFAAFSAALVHGLAMGTDSGELWLLYVAAALSVLLLASLRLVPQAAGALGSKR